MCIQCHANAVTLKQEVLPGFSLMVSTKETPSWPNGWYALVENNEPLVVFEGPLLRDPTIGMTEDDLDSQAEHPEGYDEYEAGAVRLGHSLRLHPEAGYRLVRAALTVGYAPEQSGSIQYWLLDHLAEQVEPTA